MKILLITQVLPFPPDSGPKIKTWNLIKHLSGKHQVVLVSFVRGDQSADIQQLRQYCQRVFTVPMDRSILLDGWFLLKSLASGIPWIILRDERSSMHSLIEQLVETEEFDIVHADQLNMAQYALRVNTGSRVLDAHNALWLLYRRLWETLKTGPEKLLWGREWRLLRRYEGQVCQEFDGVLAVSLSDRAALEEVMGETEKVRVIPITIDLEEVLPVQRQPPANHIVYLGTMFWRPNVEGVLWFAREVFPRIREARPDVVFDIIGARPPKEITQLSLDGNGIRVVGYVDDPTAYLMQAGAMVVPLRAGGGMRVKILQALAQQLPIVSTTLGCEGIQVESGRHLFVADTPADFARAAIQLLEDPYRSNEMGEQGRELIATCYDARLRLSEVDEAYQAWTRAKQPAK